MTQPSKGSDSYEFYEEGDNRDLYNEEEDDGFVVGGSREEGSGDGEENDDNNDEDQYEKAEDGDYTMHEIPEGEEDW